ncbi:MAG: DUF2065 domain-containing protein [Pseudomonadota bacterium]
MWNELLAACALVLIIEGILPFASPGTLKQMWQKISEMSDQSLRIMGLVSMLAGVILLTLLRQT